MNAVMFRQIIIGLALSIFACFGFLQASYAQDKASGALDFGLDYHRSMGGRNVLGAHVRAMAVDRVPGTLVGRFAELYASFGVGLEGELIQYSVGAKFGVGLGTDHLVIFLATGLMTDSYQSIKASSKEDNVSPGIGLPLLLGLWIDPMPGLYFYFMAEPSWAFLGDRETTPFIPFNWAWELRLRGGFGIDISKIHMRIDYTFHQVAPHSYHVISLGFGFSSRAMAELGKQPIKD